MVALIKQPEIVRYELRMLKEASVEAWARDSGEYMSGREPRHNSH